MGPPTSECTPPPLVCVVTLFGVRTPTGKCGVWFPAVTASGSICSRGGYEKRWERLRDQGGSVTGICSRVDWVGWLHTVPVALPHRTGIMGLSTCWTTPASTHKTNPTVYLLYPLYLYPVFKPRSLTPDFPPEKRQKWVSNGRSRINWGQHSSLNGRGLKGRFRASEWIWGKASGREEGKRAVVCPLA